MKKKICIYDPGHYKKSMGGAEIQLWILARQLTKEGYKVIYLTGDYNKAFTSEDIDIIPFKKNKRRLTNFVYFYNILKGVGADYYIQRGRKIETFFLGLYSFFNSNSKSYFFASMDLDCNRYKYMYSRNSSNLLSKTRNYLLDIFTFWGMKQMDQVFTQTFVQQTKLLSHNITSEIFRNVHELEDNIQDTSKEDIIIWIANIKNIKRPELFLDFVKKMPDKYKFIMIGRLVEKKYDKEISVIAKKFKNFSYLGEVDFKDTYNYLSKAKILINTSSSEGFSNTFIQAWASGSPVISLNVDPDNLISEKKLGFNCKGSLNTMKDKVINLMDNNDEYQEMSLRCKTFAMTNFEIKKRISDINKLFE